MTKNSVEVDFPFSSFFVLTRFQNFLHVFCSLCIMSKMVSYQWHTHTYNGLAGSYLTLHLYLFLTCAYCRDRPKHPLYHNPIVSLLVRRRGRQGGERSGGKKHNSTGENWCRVFSDQMPFLSATSAEKHSLDLILSSTTNRLLRKRMWLPFIAGLRRC